MRKLASRVSSKMEEERKKKGLLKSNEKRDQSESETNLNSNEKRHTDARKPISVDVIAYLLSRSGSPRSDGVRLRGARCISIRIPGQWSRFSRISCRIYTDIRSWEHCSQSIRSHPIESSLLIEFIDDTKDIVQSMSRDRSSYNSAAIASVNVWQSYIEIHRTRRYIVVDVNSLVCKINFFNN